MTDTAENDGLGPCPTPGEIRVFGGQRCRFIERELEGDKWVVLGPAPMTDTVRVPKAFSDWLYGVEGYGLRVERLSEELRDPVDKLLPWLLAAFEVGLAASPQGEGSSGEWITHDGGPNPVPGKRAFYRYFALGDQSDPLETTQALPSDLQDWEWPGHTAGAYDDIIAYRVTEGVKP